MDDATGLIKTTPVNYFLNSDFPVSSNSNSTITDVSGITTPDGNVSTVKRLTGSGFNRYEAQSGISATKTASVYVRTVTGTDTITIDAADDTAVSYDITEEWTRIHATGTHNNYRWLDINLNSSSDIYIWGVQIEPGATLGDYVSTTSTISGAARYENGELILEEARTNYCKDGTGFTVTSGNGRTSPNNGTFSSTTVANPTGETNTVLFTTDAVSGTSIDIGGGDSTLGYTGNAMSMFIKPNGITKIFLTTFATAGNQGAYFELTGNGSVVGVQNNLPSDQYFIDPYPNGWYRLGVINFGRVIYSLKIWEYDGANNPQFNSVTGDGTSGFYIWGWQNELGEPYWTSVIPTSGTTVTRAADVSTSALGVDSFYNQSEGTFFVEASARNRLSTHSVSTSASSYQNSTQFFGSNIETDGFYRVRTDSSLMTASFPGLTSIVPMQKYAGAYNSQSIQSALQGTVSGSVAVSGTFNPDLAHMYIGRLHSGGPYRSHIKRLSYFPTRLPDATLESITS